MPYFPKIPETNQKQIITRKFLGYNRNSEIGEGQNNISPVSSQEFYDMENLTGDYYPMMAARKKRGTVSQLASPGGCCCKDELVFVDNGKLYYDGEEVEGIELINGEKQFISMGAKIIIWPDKIAVNVLTGDYEFFSPSTEAVVTSYDSSTYKLTADTVPIVYEDVKGNDTYGGSVTQWQPIIATYGQDASAISYDEDTGEWTLPEPTYKGIWAFTGSPFSVIQQGDIVIPEEIIQVSGEQKAKVKSGKRLSTGDVTYPTIVNNTQGFYIVYDSWTGQQSSHPSGTSVTIIFDVYRCGLSNIKFSDLFKIGDRLNISSSDGTVNTQYNKVTAITDSPNSITFEADISGIPATIPSEYKLNISLPVPAMDYITEASNRIWGCKYGEVNGEHINEIYACALGDYRSWNTFQGISTDSYAASVGTDGKWTGAATFQGNPIFFKENCFHKVYVSSSGAHQISDTSCRGLQDGCDKSIAIVGDTLLYKSRSGVMAYDGSLPTMVSSALGDVNYHQAVAGSVDDKYYISMCDDAGSWNLFVLDLNKGLWHREDSTHAQSFARVRNELYYINADSKKLMCVKGSAGTLENAVAWRADTGIIGYTTIEQKYVSRFNIRMELPIGSEVNLYIQYDSDGEWHHDGHIDGKGIGSFVLPVRPRRCDHFAIRLEGTGDFKIYTLSKILESGSDVV